MKDGETTTTQITAPTQVLTTAETPGGASTAAGGGDAGTTQTTQTTQTADAPQVPDGYVKKEEVETERTARSAAETRAAEAETRASAAEQRARETEIKSVARGLNFNDPDDALALVPADATDIEATLKGVLEKKGYLAKAAEPVVTPTSPTNPARQNAQAPVFTQAQISDRTFWNANKDAIMLAMREGRVQ